jgi:hypothetical protein
MIITSHMQKIIEIYPCLLKLSRKQESVTDGQTHGSAWNGRSPSSQMRLISYSGDQKLPQIR